MFNQLLPQRIDNTYHGYRLALWLFAALQLMRIAMSANCIFNGYTVATSADGIPLDTFTPAAAQTIVYLFAAWGLAELVLSALCVLVLFRYRSLVSFMFGMLLVDLLGRKLIHHFIPVISVGRPPAYYVNLTLLTLMGLGLILSLLSRGPRPAMEQDLPGPRVGTQG